MSLLRRYHSYEWDIIHMNDVSLDETSFLWMMSLLTHMTESSFFEWCLSWLIWVTRDIILMMCVAEINERSFLWMVSLLMRHHSYVLQKWMRHHSCVLQKWMRHHSYQSCLSWGDIILMNETSFLWMMSLLMRHHSYEWCLSWLIWLTYWSKENPLPGGVSYLLYMNDILIERNPPPRGGFLFTMLPHQEPWLRGPPSKYLVQILRGGSSYSRFLMREHIK